MDVDQAAIDEILASAEADTAEGRIDRLEKELDVLKGSVKKLLLDLRETLNNLENPFQNLQNLAEGALAGGASYQPPQIQVVPAQIPEPPKPEPEVEQPETETGPEPEPEAEPELKEVKEDEPPEEDVVRELDESKSAEPIPEVMEEVDLEGDSLQAYSFEKPVKRTTPKTADLITKYDIVTLFNLMEWVKGMLEKYNLDSLTLMLELFESAGYISKDARDFICKIAELVSLNDGFEDMLLELYRLHKLMNPADTSMDSKLLSLILDKRL
ncbi:hypothetical protein [Archaeoglobus fulgidus]|uniref:Uncharacterized protein AF_1053 n=1 Tax=Archaeoglobus fulgidus (strain ATCC 49558 / DSM 4304 / JCM 9628 / NBRC 100126 / VC-16) TaxID=224325 RepID=Y1053_ARCFU|nr:hypothetical protein [Archaeoglobus fulgidus]O29209.1 RecName: Full=Uncharacterized protein AF_1053 [Archaeoglobus fulgidus DSM 4304]AAB90192.1 predicted coding region AF_1053 [Archaeoglobus fulgidus DSM 4304]